MKIIEHGTLPVRKAICRNCGAKLEAEHKELFKVASQDRILWCGHCPDCGDLVSFGSCFLDSKEKILLYNFPPKNIWN